MACNVSEPNKARLFKDADWKHIKCGTAKSTILPSATNMVMSNRQASTASLKPSYHPYGLSVNNYHVFLGANCTLAQNLQYMRCARQPKESDNKIINRNWPRPKDTAAINCSNWWSSMGFMPFISVHHGCTPGPRRPSTSVRSCAISVPPCALLPSASQRPLSIHSWEVGMLGCERWGVIW